jgi:Ca2+-binding RTX toxin-like protein
VRRASPLILALIASAFAAAPAGATESCKLDTAKDLLVIKYTEGGDRTRTFVDATGEINVEAVTGGPTIPIACSGGAPTTTNIDTIKLRDKSPGSTRIGILDPIEFAPGVTDEVFGTAEIEWKFLFGRGGNDVLFMSDLAGTQDNWTFGANGLDINSGIFNDIDYSLRGVESIEALGGDGADLIDGRGNQTTGGPLPIALFGFGGEGEDEVYGGKRDDDLDGYLEDDLVNGGPGDDLVKGGSGADRMLGKGGIDRIEANDFTPDVAINCGRGDNAKEKAVRDPEDPPAKSC